MAKSLQKGIDKGKEKKETELVIEMYKNGILNEMIAKIAKISIEKAEEIIKNYLITERGKE
jgi:hypothetical protein